MMNILQIEKSSTSDSDLDSSSSDDDDLNDIIMCFDSEETSDDSSDEDIRERNTINKIKNYYEETTIARSTIKFICSETQAANIFLTHNFGRKKIVPEKAVLLTIWYLSNTETFRQIADRFDVTKSTARRMIEIVTKYLVNNSKKFISWPNENEKISVRQGFKNMQGIDNILGAIDGSHINIKRPVVDAHVYCNRKSQHSILLQGVCDHKKRFIDVFCGEAGSIHDARLLKKSSLYERGINGLLGNDFLLGDSAYPCLNWLISPFKDNGHLTVNQRTFNFKHLSSRMVIENSFGLLKNRFRRLRYFENLDINFIVRCVVAATVLHNICISHDDYFDDSAFENHLSNTETEELNVTELSGIKSQQKRRDEIFYKMFNN